MKNKYIKVSHISEPKFREIVKLFSEDLSATQIANLTNLNRNTINRYLMLFRERIVKICEETSPLSGEVEVDESYFGASRVRGKRGRGARGKTMSLVFKKRGKVYTEIVPDVTKATLQSIIKVK
jgi:transposase